MEDVEYRIIDEVYDVPLRGRSQEGLRMGAVKLSYRALAVIELALIYKPSIEHLGDNPIIRINSACISGDILGDRRCDCTAQLDEAVRIIGKHGGLLIYDLSHEGKGAGLTEKMKIYSRLEKDGITTLSDPRIQKQRDYRSFAAAQTVISRLGLTRVRLLTDNPSKARSLEDSGIHVEILEPNQLEQFHV